MKKIISLCSIIAVIALAIVGFAKKSDPEITNDSNKEAPDPTAFDPTKPTATAIIQVHPSMLAITQGNPINRNYMEDQFEVIVAPDTLKLAAETLQIDLEEGEDALLNLKRKIKTSPMRGTDFIQITAQGTDKIEATRIANAVANAYIKLRKDQELARAQKALEALDEELIQQSEMVQKQREALKELIQKYGIPYFDGRHSSPMGATEEQMYRSASKKLADFETQRDQIESSLKLKFEKDNTALVRHFAGLDLPENQVTHYYTQHLEALQQKQALIAKDLGASHPSIVAAEKRAATAMTNAQKETVSLKAVLKTKLELINRQIERMSEMLESRKDDTVDLALKEHAYNQAMATYEQSRDILREIKIKQQETRVLLKMPRQPTTLHQRAK